MHLLPLRDLLEAWNIYRPPTARVAGASAVNGALCANLVVGWGLLDLSRNYFAGQGGLSIPAKGAAMSIR